MTARGAVRKRRPVAVWAVAALAAWLVAAHRPAYGVGSGEPAPGGGPPGETLVVGERLIYHIHYSGVPAGRAVIELAEVVPFGRRKVYKMTARATASRLFSVFYPVRDLVVTYVDTETLLPLWYEKHLREGRDYTNDEVTLFDRKAGLARNWNLSGAEAGAWPKLEAGPAAWDTPGGSEVAIPEGVQDALSSFYHLRGLELVKGQTIVVPVNADEKNYSVEIKVLGKEKLAIKGRAVATVKVHPVLRQVKLGGILKEKGDIFIWLSDDERRVPVRIQGRVVVGAITLSLVSRRVRKTR